MKVRKGRKTDLEEASIGTCENCKTENTKVRSVEFFSAIKLGPVNASRGFMKLCYYCHGPHILWISKKYGNMRTPMNPSKEALDRFMIVDTKQ